MVETREEVKDKSSAKEAEVSDKQSGVLLLVRKRIQYSPSEKEGITLLELGHWLTGLIKTPYEALEALKAFGMPKTGQMMVDGRAETAQVTIKKRHLKARNKVKKDRHEELTQGITGAREFIKHLKHYEMVGDQIEVVTTKEEALTVIETFKKRIAPKAGRK
ncbi:hypothetical protein KAW50_07420 [candidate division WOR-3 bacterium]|nr:hypothetical protein [candidate division WOR-3 bacterium]